MHLCFCVSSCNEIILSTILYKNEALKYLAWHVNGVTFEISSGRMICIYMYVCLVYVYVYICMYAKSVCARERERGEEWAGCNYYKIRLTLFIYVRTHVCVTTCFLDTRKILLPTFGNAKSLLLKLIEWFLWRPVMLYNT